MVIGHVSWQNVPDFLQIARHVACETTSSSNSDVSKSACPIFFFMASHLLTGKSHNNMNQIALNSQAHEARKGDRDGS